MGGLGGCRGMVLLALQVDLDGVKGLQVIREGSDDGRGKKPGIMRQVHMAIPSDLLGRENKAVQEGSHAKVHVHKMERPLAHWDATHEAIRSVPGQVQSLGVTVRHLM